MGDSTSRIEPAHGFNEPDRQPPRSSSKDAKQKPRPRVTWPSKEDEWSGETAEEFDDPSEAQSEVRFDDPSEERIDDQEIHNLDTMV